MKIILAALLSLVALTGCITRGVDYNTDLTWIHVKQTTQAQVSEKLGSPDSVGNSSGTPTWTYTYFKGSLFSDTYNKELKFYWSADHKVQDYSFNSSFPEDRRINGGLPVGN